MGDAAPLGLFLLPGLGADARQFAPQQAAFPALRVLPWIASRAQESLRGYAARLAAERGVPRGAVVGGSSFGGMVALEVARAVGARAAVLIGSCRTRRAVAPWLLGAAAASRVLPAPLVDPLRPCGRMFVRLAGPMPPEHRRLLLEMARDAPAPFLKWAAGAIASWPGCEDPGVPVRHIHGGRDRIIPVRRVRADMVVAGAGHVPNLTHAPEVNSFLNAALEA